ncbi:MAG: TldD/PmbA family protein [Methanobacteriota archaeon]|nr:MAG: TldD/PmbA family protein [Euryarchaeota archaeon]
MIDEDTAERTLDQVASGASPELAEVKLVSLKAREMSIKSGQVHSVSSSTDAGMYVRVVLDTGIGFASVNRISRSAGRDLAKRAVRLAKASKRKERVKLSHEKAAKARWSVRQRMPLGDVSTEDRMSYLKSLDSAVTGTGLKVQGRFFEVADVEISSYLATTDGARISSFLPRVRMNCLNMVTSKGETEQSFREWGSVGGWERTDEWGAGPALSQEMKMLKNLIDKGKAVKPGTYDLICGPEVTGIASHESCGHPMEADRILGREMSQAGKSFVKPEMIGDEIGSELATVIDDPTVPGSYGYYEYDDEGVRAKPRFLYKKGVINEFLHNRETAGRLGVKSNASSRSSVYWKEPIVRMANTFVAPGDMGEDEMIASVKDGVYMNSFTEWNIDDKRYNQKYVSREAYFVRNGKVAGPARNCVLEITTPRFWKSIDAVSKRIELIAAECGKGDPMQDAAVYAGGPMLRLREVNLR